MANEVDFVVTRYAGLSTSRQSEGDEVWEIVGINPTLERAKVAGPIGAEWREVWTDTEWHYGVRNVQAWETGQPGTGRYRIVQRELRQNP